MRKNRNLQSNNIINTTNPCLVDWKNIFKAEIQILNNLYSKKCKEKPSTILNYPTLTKGNRLHRVINCSFKYNNSLINKKQRGKINSILICKNIIRSHKKENIRMFIHREECFKGSWKDEK